MNTRIRALSIGPIYRMLTRDLKHCPTSKLNVYIQRHRGTLSVVFYVILTVSCVALLYDPWYIESLLSYIIPAIIGKSAPSLEQDNDRVTKGAASTPSPKRTLQKLINLPFTPKNFNCEEMLEQAGRNFTYLETYWDHLDAYKTALGLNDILAHSASNEHAWILQEMARLPFVKTVCETGFDAGATSFQWLVGNEDVNVYSFDDTKKNYSLEMVDFMSIEFPERFYLYPGNIEKTVNAFASKREGKVRCDLVFVDSTQPAETIRANLKDLARLANRVENLVVMDSHPRNTPDSEVHRVWQEFSGSGTITEHFRCYFANLSEIGKERGLTVGSFSFN